MMGSAEAGKIFGIPIMVDGSFLLLVLLYGFGHFSSSSAGAISYGALLVSGVALSILLHELGHALAARQWGVATAYIELNGIGGLCHFARNMPPDRIANIVMLLAGPAANLLLWQAFSVASNELFRAGDRNPGSIAFLCQQLGQVNLALLIFNLMPAHPLDGGRTLVQIISKLTGYDRAMRGVAYLGMLVALWLLFLVIGGNFFALLIAAVLFQTNLAVLQRFGGPRWRR